MSDFEPGSYQLPQLLQRLSGKEQPSDEFRESIRQWRDLQTTSIDLGQTKIDKFTRGVIYEQSAENLRPFIEIISNSIDAILENSEVPPQLEIIVRLINDGGLSVEISDKGQGIGMTSEVFLQKYLPPSASTKGQAWSSSIGQMGVGANQQYSLVRRKGDSLLVTSTGSDKHATLMGVKQGDNGLVATLASGTAPETDIPNGLDKQGTITRISMSAQTAEEIGFTIPAFIGYLQDRFGGYTQAGLKVTVTGDTTRISQGSHVESGHFDRLTPNREYIDALKINFERTPVATQVVGNQRVRTTYIISEVGDLVHQGQQSVEATLSQDYLVTDRAEKYKTAMMTVSDQRSDTCLVYFSVLGVRFGEPHVVRGYQIPNTIDINLDYRIGQISENRSELRLSEFDYLRIGRLIDNLSDSKLAPETVMQVASALSAFCTDFDDRSPNKLRKDLHLATRLKMALEKSIGSIDPIQVWPKELENVLPDGHQFILISTKNLERYYFKLSERPGVQRVGFLSARDTDVYCTKFSGKDSSKPFVWTDNIILINLLLFPDLFAKNSELRRAEQVKVLACISNLQESVLTADLKMSVTPHFHEQEISEGPDPGMNKRRDRHDELNLPSEILKGINDLQPQIEKKIADVEGEWEKMTLTQKKEVVLSFVKPDRNADDGVDVIKALGLINEAEFNDFFPLLIGVLKNGSTLRENLNSWHRLDFMNGSRGGKAQARENLEDFFKVELSHLQKHPDVSWERVRKTSELLQAGISGQRFLRADQSFYDMIEQLSDEEQLLCRQLAHGEGSKGFGLEEDEIRSSQEELLGLIFFLHRAKEDPKLIEVIQQVSNKALVDIFIGSHDRSEAVKRNLVFHGGGGSWGVDIYGTNELFGNFDDVYSFYSYVLTEGHMYNVLVLEILFTSCHGNMDKFKTALWLANQYNLSSEEVEAARENRSSVEPNLGVKALHDFLHTDYSLQSRSQDPFSDAISDTGEPISAAEIIGFAQASDQTEKGLTTHLMARLRSMSAELGGISSENLHLRKLLQHINSVEPGLGGSIHEAIKNAVQAIIRAKKTSELASDLIQVTDFYELDSSSGEQKQGFGFRLEDQAGWQDASEAVFKLTVPGEGEGLHGVHFLTLLKEYDVVRVRATDQSGKTAFIEYRRVVDKKQQKVVDVKVRYVLDESSSCPTGTVVEGVKWTQYPQADSAMFRFSVDRYAKNVPADEASITFWDGSSNSEPRTLNAIADTILAPLTIEGFGQVSALVLSKDWYSPEVTIDHVPVNFALVDLIKNCSFIPKPFQELLTSSGLTLNISMPEISIIRSTLEFKNQTLAYQVLSLYLEQNWQRLFMTLFQQGKINLSKGGFLSEDVWTDPAFYGSAGRSIYRTEAKGGKFAQWYTLDDLKDIGQFLYYEPLLEIKDKPMSIAEIIFDQQLHVDERKLTANDIPLNILTLIQEGKQRNQRDETASYVDTVKYQEAPENVKTLLINGIYKMVQRHIDGTSGIIARVHTGNPRGIPFEAFYIFGKEEEEEEEWVTFELGAAQRNVEMMKEGNMPAFARLLEVSAHELEHARRKDGNGESPFYHTRDFYEKVQRNILSVPASEIASFLTELDNFRAHI